MEHERDNGAAESTKGEDAKREGGCSASSSSEHGSTRETGTASQDAGQQRQGSEAKREREEEPAGPRLGVSRTGSSSSLHSVHNEVVPETGSGSDTIDQGFNSASGVERKRAGADEGGEKRSRQGEAREEVQPEPSPSTEPLSTIASWELLSPQVRVCAAHFSHAWF